jgi:lipoyl-dependent peroxiredoxin subunit D
MPLTEILRPTRDDARVEELLGRVREKLAAIPVAYETLALSPSFLDDSLFNLRRTLVDGALDVATKHLIAVAVASAAGGSDVVEARALDARADGVGDDAIVEAMTVAASMTSFNTFYKFIHMAGPGYAEMRPGLKLSVFLRPNVLTKLQVELIAAIVSTVNGCDSCVHGHVAACRDMGASLEQIAEALRVGAVVAGLAAFGGR